MPNSALWIIPSRDHLIKPGSQSKSFSAGDDVRREYELNINK